MQRRSLILTLAVLTVPAALNGCGFKMRGASVMPFRTLYTSFTTSSPVGNVFRRLLRSEGGTEFVTTPEKADLRLMILSDLREREIVGYSASGRPSLYQLRQKLRYQLMDGKAELIGSESEIVIRRDITTSDALLNAKQQEEEYLYVEMQDDIAQQLIRRLSAVKLNASSR
jgi:LPS-assembly lipoprotein